MNRHGLSLVHAKAETLNPETKIVIFLFFYEGADCHDKKQKFYRCQFALTGLMGALVYIATMFFKVEIPVGGDRTMIGFANVFCVLSGLILGPAYGGLAAGVGSFLFDITGGWFSSAGVTLITKV